ncbi:MAG: HAD-IC family P-type ATPase [Phycisphaeraceae bacterium]|nr:HAD-IC family P-type ATPase [Phycisphaeraceae bacterium]
MPKDEAEPQQTAWHSLPLERMFPFLNSGPQGLSRSEAQARISRYGPNRIERSRREGAWRTLLRQLATPLVYILLVSVVAAMLLGKVTDGIVILAVVVINSVVGFLQERKAGEAIAALSRMVPLNATVLCDGDPLQVPAYEIVPGDVVLLQAGDRIPADLRLIELDNLHTDEAALTGESLPVPKHVDPVPQDAAVGDRRCMVFGGTLVTSGSGTAIAVATGTRTELGRISELLGETRAPDTPLARRLAKLAAGITTAIIIVALLILAAGLLREYPLIDSLMAAITLAVAAIPEGLPAAITIASAIGIRRMARRNVIIRRLPAVETLGSVTVICTDKTGTLTRNEMTVQALCTPKQRYSLSGIGYVPAGELTANGKKVESIPPGAQELLLAAALCNDAHLVRCDGRWSILGDPTEAALLVATCKAGLDYEALRERHPRIDVLPFDSERQYMATLHHADHGSRLVCLKGAPERVVGFCHALADGAPLDPVVVHDAVEEMAVRGMRVLAIASGPAPGSLREFDGASPATPLRFLGLAGMIDPPREEVPSAIHACRTAGIAVKMITGDHPHTARAIAVELSLLERDAPADSVVSGPQIATASDVDLEELARSHNVFARVSPEHKLRLVRALQACGEVVAMTGDGVNDAPALRRADIGVAMGIGGTAVAQEAAEMVLADNNFASIEAAVEEGRRVYDNLIKSLTFMLPTSLGQAMIILVAVVFFPVHDGRLLMPINPVQILWVNLVVAITLALPLAFEAPEPDVMTRHPRSAAAPLLDAFLVGRTFLVAALLAAGAVGLFHYEYHTDLRLGIDPGTALAESQTIAVTTIIVFQAVYLLNCRSLTESAWRIGIFSNRYVYYGITTALVLQLCFVYLPPLNRLFHTHRLSLADWVAPTLVALAGLPVIAMEKRFWRWRRGPTRARRTSGTGGSRMSVRQQDEDTGPWPDSLP